MVRGNISTQGIVGICLIVIGVLVFIGSSCGLIKNLMSNRTEYLQQSKTNLKERGISGYFSEEEIESQFDTGRKHAFRIQSRFILIGLSLVIVGFAFYRKRT
jgi:hypothetical protein